MLITKAFKTELDPNNKQLTLLNQNAGCSRFVYNWALGLLIEDYKTDKSLKPNAIELHRLLNSKKESEFPWMYECSKWTMQNALRSLETAYLRFFKGLGDFPKFKKKSKGNDSFTVNEIINVTKTTIQLPKIGVIRLKEHDYIPEGSYKSATVTLRAGRYLVSVQKEINIEERKDLKDEALGVDPGVKTFITCSDGTSIPPHKALKKHEKRLKRLQRKLERQKKGSKSREKTKLRFQKEHLKITNIRKDLINKTTSLLVKTKPEKTIVIEDLNVKGMLKNHKLAKAIADVGFGEFRRQMEYKSKWYGKTLILANRFFPSSKMDHKSGEINKSLTLKDRIIYHKDGSKTDRDLNAAINLKNYPTLWMEEYPCKVKKEPVKLKGKKKVVNTVRYTEIKAVDDLRLCKSVKAEENRSLINIVEGSKDPFDDI